MRIPPDTDLRPAITGWFSEFTVLADRQPLGRVAYGRGGDQLAGATYDPTSHYRAVAVFDFFREHGLTPALLAAFLWKRVTPAGGTASIAAGMLTTTLITWKQEALTHWMNQRWGFTGEITEYMIYPAVFASVFCLVVVSLLTPASPEERWRPFMETTAR